MESDIYSGKEIVLLQEDLPILAEIIINNIDSVSRNPSKNYRNQLFILIFMLSLFYCYSQMRVKFFVRSGTVILSSFVKCGQELDLFSITTRNRIAWNRNHN